METFQQICSSNIELMHCLKQNDLCAKNEKSHESSIREEFVFFHKICYRTQLIFASPFYHERCFRKTRFVEAKRKIYSFDQ